MSSRLARQRGVTLIELIVFMVVVGIALMGIIAVMNADQRAAPPIRYGASRP
jgi:prepilin-type N-terminal cleavage/methylation domain-containing protein